MKPKFTACSGLLALCFFGVLRADPTPQLTPVQSAASTPASLPMPSPAAVPTSVTTDARRQALDDLALASSAAAAVPSNPPVSLPSDIGATRAWAGDVEGAIKTWQGDHSISLDDILKVEAAAGDAAGAVANARRLLKSPPNGTFLEIIAGLIETHRLTEAKAVASGFTGDEPRNEALYKVAAAQADAGDFAAAAATADAISAEARTGHASFQTTTRDHLIDAEVKAGKTDAARAVADASKPEDQRAIQLRHLAVAQARQGDLAGANATRDTILHSTEKAKATFGIVLTQALKGDLAAIAYITVRREEVGDIEQQNALTSVVRALAQMDQVKAAIKVAKTIDEPQARAYAICEVAEVQAKAGHMQAAQATLDGIDQKDSVAQYYEEMAQADLAETEAKTGDIKGAKAMAKPLGDGMNSIALSFILQVQAKAGDLNGAKATLDSARDFFRGTSVTEVIVAAQVRKEGFPATEAWVKTLRDPYLRATGYVALARARLNLPDEDLEHSAEHLFDDVNAEANDG